MRSSSSSSPMFDLREAVEGLRDAFTPRYGGKGGDHGHHGHHDVRSAVMIALLDHARTGAEVIEAIAAESEGHWRPKPGAVYPLLQLLVDEGLVASEQRDDKKVYALTEAGRIAAEAAAAEHAAHDHEHVGHDHARSGRDGWKAPNFPRMSEHDVLVPKSGAKLAQAAAQVAQVGTADQKKRAAELLDETRKRLYAILAED
ncbi:PadR family transcriptional regulator [Microcella putealis]|uniref:PadR family transcriptional regulator n=1 Tax=Microcella putealis TaxID=337005 RepID=A0A4Q7LY87_9MICO|nr:PadR family transcriptional regulator [Microcella putealis]RZS59754.1 PadR family transcriptional regulator [Microcella putealis]TQM26867.1 PadR family transcriptional regulator [Microcella putealis]